MVPAFSARMQRIRHWALLLLVLVAAACSPAIGDRSNPTPETTTASNDADTVFGAAELAGFQRVGGYALSPVIKTTAPATRGGFLIDLWGDVGNVPIGAEVRGVRADGTNTDWFPAKSTWREAPHVVARAELGEAVNATQFRIPIDQIKLIENVIYAGVTPQEHDPGDSRPSSGVGSTQQGLTSELIGLVQPRSAWGARPAKCSSSDPHKYRMAIHHTFTPPSSSGGYESRIRSIQAFHQDVRGWCDIGYHFLVTEDGRVWEGRPVDTMGAHTHGNNTGNIGLSWVGCFDSKACSGISSSNVPSDAALQAAGQVMHALAQKYGINPSTSNVKGHRDWPGQSTECPGDELEGKIPDLISMAAGQAPAPAPTPTGDPGRAIGVVWDLSQTSSPSSSGNVRIGGATISVEGGPSTAARDGDALWLLSLAPGSYTITASAPGYATATETVEVKSGADTWASIGLLPDNSGNGGSGGSGGSGGATGSGGSSGASGSGGSGGGSSTPPASYSTPESSWTCGGTAGTHPSQSGSYYTTTFGCYVDESGTAHGDPGDNCVPWCMTGAASQGRSAEWNALCGGMSGPDCERSVNWYSADADRFGCGARIKITNPKTGKSAVVAVIDRGPACWVESKVDHWGLDLSYPASSYLFGGQTAITEKAEVIAVEVPTDTPLGPVQ